MEIERRFVKKLTNDYYVYIYWRLDTNEPFYGGKGKAYRWCQLCNRGKHFKNIENKYQIVCEIVMNNLTEEQAHGIECWIINELVFEYGYSIDISNNRSSEKGMHLVNCTWGGEGVSGWKANQEQKNKISKSKKGENNYFYGKYGKDNPNYGRHHTEEAKKKMSESHKNYRGENHPMYGKHHSEETKKKMSDIRKGENHTFYGIKRPEHSEKMSGKNNPMYGKQRTKDVKRKIGKSVICLTTKRIFFTSKEGGEYYNIKTYKSIGQCCRGKLKSCGKLFDGTPLKWRFIKWNHNKRYRIKKRDK